MAALRVAVTELLCRSIALYAFTDDLGLIREVMNHAVIKDVEGTFPERVISELLTVLHDAAINLVDLFKAALDHHG